MPRRGDQQHNFPSVPEQLTRAGRIGIRLVRAADQTGTLRDIALDPNEFRCARLAGELADEWVDYAENQPNLTQVRSPSAGERSGISVQKPTSYSARTPTGQVWRESIPTSRPSWLSGSEPFRLASEAGSPTPAAYAGSVRGLIARRAQHDRRPVTAALCRLVDGAKGVPSRQQPP